MTLAIYLPTNLSEQINAFKAASGNVNIDYRSTSEGDFSLLGTPYTKVSSNIIPIDCFPFEPTEEHVSGINSLYREFTVDVVLRNLSADQRHYFISSNTDQIISVNYSYTEVERVGNVSTLYHYYSVSDPSVIVSLTGKTLKSCIYSQSNEEVGLVNQRTIGKLSLSNLETTLTSNNIRIKETTSENIPTNSLYPPDLVNPYIVSMKSVLANSGQSQISVKTRVVAHTDLNGEVTEPSILSTRLTNYNLYCEDSSIPYEHSDAISVALRGGEQVLLSMTVVNNSNNLESNLNSFLSFSERFSPDFGIPFLCFKCILPEESPNPLRISIDDGKSWTSLGTYSEANPSDFSSDLTTFFRDKGINCYPCADSVFILQNIKGPETDMKLVIQHHPEFEIETLTDTTTIETLTGYSIPYTKANFPENLSICFVELRTESNTDFVQYGLRIPKSDVVVSTLFSDNLLYSVDTTLLLTSTSVQYRVNGQTFSEVLDLTASSEETVIDDLVEKLSLLLNEFTIRKENSGFSITSPSSVLFSFSCVGITLETEVKLYENIEGMKEFILRGSS